MSAVETELKKRLSDTEEKLRSAMNALPDPSKLEMLSKWFSTLDSDDDENTEIEDDLMEWAKRIRQVQADSLKTNNSN